MSTKRLKILTTLCCLFPCFLIGQADYLVGLLPTVNLNYKLDNNWSLNSKVESRGLLEEGTFGLENQGSDVSYILTDFSLIAAKKFGLASKISAGYLSRFREDEIVHRLIQQYTVVQQLPTYRLSHRVVADQTFSPSESPEFRLRYRIASELPFEGQSTDPSEFYLKLGNEYLGSVQGSDYDLEIRLVPMLGYYISPNQKAELGLDYRVRSFLTSDTRHTFWMSMNWYISI